jgi:hypothetical protein
VDLLFFLPDHTTAAAHVHAAVSPVTPDQVPPLSDDLSVMRGAKAASEEGLQARAEAATCDCL